VVCAALTIVPLSAKSKKQEPLPAAPLDRYLAELEARSPSVSSGSPGSLFSSRADLADATRDLRAARLHDLVTILVSDRASAITTGATNTSRKSSARASVNALGGALNAGTALPNLATMSGAQQLDGQGTTSRTSSFSTSLSARVTHVLPNGNLVVQGEKSIWINSEHQSVVVRGIVRISDIGAGNVVPSDRLSDLEVRINGKGVVGDSVRRPMFLYRLLLGLLPF
jgi:flagellar L-ring protein precursor FlgH